VDEAILQEKPEKWKFGLNFIKLMPYCNRFWRLLATVTGMIQNLPIHD